MVKDKNILESLLKFCMEKSFWKKYKKNMNIASIDIGSNTVLLLICEVSKNGSLGRTILNLQRIPRISSGLKPGDEILDNKIDLLMEVLDEYKKVIDENDVELVFSIATNALRIASNRNNIVERIRKNYGWITEIISGEREAFLSYIGATYAFKKDLGKIVIDIGGGSTEIVFGAMGKIYYKESFPIGVVSLLQYVNSNPPTIDEIILIESIVKSKLMRIKLPETQHNIAIAVAGTPTTLSCIKQNLNDFNEEKVNNSKLSLEELNLLIKTLSSLSTIQIYEKYGNVVAGREDVLLTGSIILKIIMEMFGLTEIVVSTKGLRYGVLIDFLDNRINIK